MRQEIERHRPAGQPLNGVDLGRRRTKDRINDPAYGIGHQRLALRSGKQRGPDVDDLAALRRAGTEFYKASRITITCSREISDGDPGNIAMRARYLGTIDRTQPLVAWWKGKDCGNRMNDSLVRRNDHAEIWRRGFEGVVNRQPQSRQ